MRPHQGLRVALAAILTSHISSFAPPPALASFFALTPSRHLDPYFWDFCPVKAPEIRQRIRAVHRMSALAEGAKRGRGRPKSEEKQQEEDAEAALYEEFTQKSELLLKEVSFPAPHALLCYPTKTCQLHDQTRVMCTSTATSRLLV